MLKSAQGNKKEVAQARGIKAAPEQNQPSPVHQSNWFWLKFQGALIQESRGVSSGIKSSNEESSLVESSYSESTNSALKRNRLVAPVSARKTYIDLIRL